MRILPTLLLIAVGLSTGCAPVITEMQSARLVDYDTAEVTPTVTTVGVDSSEKQIHALGVQFARRMSRNAEMRFRLEHYTDFDDYSSTKVTELRFGPKISIAPGTAAFAITAGVVAGTSDDESFLLPTAIEPALIFTIPISRQFEINPSTKLLIVPGGTPLIATNLGVAISTDLRVWALRAEYGLLHAPDGGEPLEQLGFGVTFAIPTELYQ